MSGLQGLQASLKRLEIDVTVDETELMRLGKLALAHTATVDVMGALLRALISTIPDRGALETAFRAALSDGKANLSAWWEESPPPRPTDDDGAHAAREAETRQLRAACAAIWIDMIRGCGEAP